MQLVGYGYIQANNTSVLKECWRDVVLFPEPCFDTTIGYGIQFPSVLGFLSGKPVRSTALVASRCPRCACRKPQSADERVEVRAWERISAGTPGYLLGLLDS